MELEGLKILDACCGGKMFWFDKDNTETLYIDNRTVPECMVGKDRNARRFSVGPDHVMDFRNMDLPNDTFKLVVFDPPHFTSAGPNSYMGKKYGVLDKSNWQTYLREGFSECFRVLRPDGILIFKWNEHNIKVSKILEQVEYRPLFGHPSGKAQKTHWLCFMKTDNMINIAY